MTRLTAADLAGDVRLRPGRADSVLSTRRDWVPRLTAGRPAAALPELLGALFSLCAHAHRWTMRAALAAAQGLVPAQAGAERQAHRVATLKEQLLRIAHDWPRSLPGAPALPAEAWSLRECPLWRADLVDAERLASLRGWLAQHWLAMPLADWLADWRADPTDAIWHWAAQRRTPLAALLDSQQAACSLATPGPSLRLPARDMAALAEAMLAPGFTLQPQWRGARPDTGPWSRQAAPLAHASAGDRLVARLVEVARLASDTGAELLDHGALALAEGEAIAWTEMSRGLLVHRVRLADAPAGPLVADARVLAPTEWNFQSQGTLARALSALDPADRDGAARLAVAFDPCVPFVVDGPAPDHNGAMAPQKDPSCMS